MLDKIAAVELKNYILNLYDNDDDDYLSLDVDDIRHFARCYVHEYCFNRTTIYNIFSPDTLEYVFLLLQGLK